MITRVSILVSMVFSNREFYSVSCTASADFANFSAGYHIVQGAIFNPLTSMYRPTANGVGS